LLSPSAWRALRISLSRDFRRPALRSRNGWRSNQHRSRGAASRSPADNSLRHACRTASMKIAGRASCHSPVQISCDTSLNTVCVGRFADRRQDSSTGGVCIEGSRHSLHASKSDYSNCCALSDSVKPQQPSAIALLAVFEAINTLARTQGRSPGVVPDQTKLSVTDGAARRRVPVARLKIIVHLCLLWSGEVNFLADVEIRSALAR
jgi:hypothetical protein